MAVEIATPLFMTDYPAIFRGYIVRSTQDVLSRVQQIEGLLPAAEREQALHTLSYALNLPEAWPDTRSLLLTMAPKMEQAGYRDEWIPYLQQGIQQSQTFGDIEAEAELHFQLGRVYRLRSKYKKARLEFETSVKGFEHLSAPLNRARGMNRLAQVARLERQFEEATHLAEVAIGLVGDEEPERAYSYLVLGIIEYDKRNWEGAISFYKQSLKLWEQGLNQRMMGRCLMSMASALLPIKRYEEAIDVCQKAITIFEKLQDPVHRAITQMNLGNVYHYIDQSDKAVELHLQAEWVFRQARDRFYLALVRHNLGMAYRRLQQWEKAEEAYLSSIEQREKIGDVARLVNTIDGLGLVYLGQGQHAKAIVTFNKALSWLKEIEGEPGHEKYFEMVRGHLEEAYEQVVER